MNSRILRTDVLDFNICEVGTGPLVVLLHGFPDLAIGWQNQLGALADAGYRVVAPDLRGYGDTGGPEEETAYSIFTLVGDVVALVEGLGEKQAVVIGHDWGAALAWECALARPDMFKGVMGLSVPFQPRQIKGPPTRIMRQRAIDDPRGALYILAMQEEALIDQLDRDIAGSLRKIFWAFDGATPARSRATGFIPPGETLTSVIEDGAVLPPWMSQTLFDRYVDAYSRTGFGRAVNWYRKIDDNWQRSRWQQGCRISVPAAFVVGDCDPVRNYTGHQEAVQARWLEDFRFSTVLPGAGHWLMHERPQEVTDCILSFLWELSWGKDTVPSKKVGAR